jgi:hypothetical protein
MAKDLKIMRQRLDVLMKTLNFKLTGTCIRSYDKVNKNKPNSKKNND